MNGIISDREREQIVRSCRTTIGDERRHVRYVTDDRRESLYTRDDVPRHADSDAAVPSHNRERDPDRRVDASHVVIFENETGYAVFVGRPDETVCRCDAESPTPYGEVDTAIRAILKVDRSNRTTGPESGRSPDTNDE